VRGIHCVPLPLGEGRVRDPVPIYRYVDVTTKVPSPDFYTQQVALEISSPRGRGNHCVWERNQMLGLIWRERVG